MIDRTIGGIGKDAGDREAGETFGQRSVALGQAGDAVLPVLCRRDQLVDLAIQLLFHREGLDDGDALDGLLHRAQDVAVEH